MREEDIKNILWKLHYGQGKDTPLGQRARVLIETARDTGLSIDQLLYLSEVMALEGVK